jgi:hypothetical protein
VQGYWHGLTVVVVRSLNLYAILTFLFYFGVTGLVVRLFTRAGLGLVFFLATFIGLAAALLCGAILSRVLNDTSGLVTRENSGVKGREVVVTRRIRDGGTGEIIYVPPGQGAQNLPARSIDGRSIPVGQSVLVVDVKRGVALVRWVDLSFTADAAADDEDTDEDAGEDIDEDGGEDEDEDEDEDADEDEDEDLEA